MALHCEDIQRSTILGKQTAAVEVGVQRSVVCREVVCIIVWGGETRWVVWKVVALFNPGMILWLAALLEGDLRFTPTLGILDPKFHYLHLYRYHKIPGDGFSLGFYRPRFLNTQWNRIHVHSQQESQSLLMRRSCIQVMKRPWDLAKIQLNTTVDFLLLLAPWPCWQHRQP